MHHGGRAQSPQWHLKSVSSIYRHLVQQTKPIRARLQLMKDSRLPQATAAELRELRRWLTTTRLGQQQKPILPVTADKYIEHIRFESTLTLFAESSRVTAALQRHALDDANVDDTQQPGTPTWLLILSAALAGVSWATSCRRGACHCQRWGCAVPCRNPASRVPSSPSTFLRCLNRPPPPPPPPAGDLGHSSQGCLLRCALGDCLHTSLEVVRAS